MGKTKNKMTSDTVSLKPSNDMGRLEATGKSKRHNDIQYVLDYFLNDWDKIAVKCFSTKPTKSRFQKYNKYVCILNLDDKIKGIIFNGDSSIKKYINTEIRRIKNDKNYKVKIKFVDYYSAKETYGVLIIKKII